MFRSPQNLWRALIIAAVLLVSYSYFPDLTGGANQDSRFGLTRAIVESHRLYIDGYERASMDKALRKGHAYSDKAPGLALIAVPVWKAGRVVLHLLHRETTGQHSLWIERHFVTVVCVALPCALAAALLFLIALEFGASLDGAAFAAMALGLATPFWIYATLFWGHALAASFLVFAFAAAVCLRRSSSPLGDFLWGIALGLAAACATVTDFPAVIPATILVVLGVAYVWHDGVGRLSRVAAGVALGGLPCLLVLLTFNALAFGSPFKLGYSLSAQQGWPLMQQGIMGVTYPKLFVLREILVGRYRGVLPLAPALIAAPLGFLLLWKEANARAAMIAASSIAVFYVLFNASYALWDGGCSFGPRFLSPALPFLCLPLALLWTRSSSGVRLTLGILAAYGWFISLLALSTDVMPSTTVRSPVQDLFWPGFSTGHVTWNVGTLLGLHGWYSLVPLVVIWAAACDVWLQLNARSVHVGPVGHARRSPQNSLESNMD